MSDSNNEMGPQTDEIKEVLMEEFFSGLVNSIQDKLGEDTEEVNVFVNQDLIATFYPSVPQAKWKLN